MATLTNINRCSQDTFNQIIQGTHATETYDPNAIYEVELDEPVELGAADSCTTINNNNQLIVNKATTVSSSSTDDELATAKCVYDALSDKYEKPSGGIPSTDMTTAVQTSLNKANTALQTHQDISGKENTSNKVTSISSSSTDAQYPSAKLLYDQLQTKKAYVHYIHIWDNEAGTRSLGGSIQFTLINNTSATYTTVDQIWNDLPDGVSVPATGMMINYDDDTRAYGGGCITPSYANIYDANNDIYGDICSTGSNWDGCNDTVVALG